MGEKKNFSKSPKHLQKKDDMYYISCKDRLNRRARGQRDSDRLTGRIGIPSLRHTDSVQSGRLAETTRRETDLCLKKDFRAH